MTLFRATIEKTLQLTPSDKWTNVYHINAASILDAQDISDSIAALEQAIYKDYVAITRIAVANPAVPGSSSSRNVYLAGSVTGDSTLMLPLFNTVLVQLLPAAGRPSPKYLRLPLQEGDVTSGKLTSTLTGFVDTNYSVPLVALTGVADEDGQDIIGYNTPDRVQMRQLGWHRRTRPGYKRGWVPV